MFNFRGGFGGGYGGGYPGISNQSFYGASSGFGQGFGGNRGTSLEGIASLVNMFAQMSPEQFDTGIARLARFKDVYGSGNFGGMGGNNFSGQSLFSSSPLGMSNFRQPNGLGMPFGNSIRQGSVNAPSFSSPALNPLSKKPVSNASLTGAGVTRTLQGPGGQSMQVLANDPRFSGKTEADIQQMVFGPPQGLSSLEEQQRLLAGGVATGGQGQLGQLPQDYTPSPSGPEIPAGFTSTVSTGNSSYYQNPQTGESFTMFHPLNGAPASMSEIRPAPEGYQPREIPSRFQGLAKLRR